ncbi:MAG: rsxB 9 [Firmicutes bacterium]|nr:rsxB 9 [Bacillota bacterium]
MKSKKALLLRYTLQFISLLSFILLLAVLAYPPELENQLLQSFSRLDPWLLLSQLRWQQEVPSWAWLPLLTLVSTLLWGRIFCGWLCPFGALLTLTDKIGRAAFPKLSLLRTKVLRAVQPVRGYWFIFLGTIFVLGSNWVFFFTPFALFSHEIVRGLQGDIPWMLIGIIVGTLLFSRLWCSVLCPTGVLLSLVARLRFFRCELAGAKPQESRRQFFKVAFAVAMAGALWRKTVWAAEKVLRPPGALPELDFTAVCNRCGRCIQVCPSNALRPMPITEGLANFETPYVIPRKNRCDLCLACQKVCPTGAIAQVPLEKIRMGKAVIDKPRCIAWNDGKMCYICGEQCPVLAISADEHHRPTVLSDKCVGCGSCENACPVNGEAAIRVIPA